MSIELLIAIALVFVTSLVSTMSGFGLATIMIPVLLLRYPLPETLLLVAVIHFMGDFWKIWLFRQGVNWRLVLTFVSLGIPMTALGAWLVPLLPQQALARTLGAFILAYVAVLVLKPAFHVAPTPSRTVAGGALYGFAAGIFGISGAIRSAVLAAYDLPKAVFLFTSGAVSLFIDTTRIATYLASGVALVGISAWNILLLIPVSFAGAIVAKRFLSHISHDRFKHIIAFFLFLAGLKLLLLP